MKVTTWNVNGLRAREAQVLEWLEREQPEVLCLQEIKASRQQVPQGLAQLSDYWNFWHGGEGGYSGVSLHVRKACAPVRPAFFHPAFDHEQRIVTVALGALTVASIYVPNGGKDFEAKVRFLDALQDFVAQAHAQGQLLLLCGDLNVALTERDVHEKLRDTSTYGQTPGERAQLSRILGSGLIDLGRHFAPDADALFTWWAPWRNHRARNIGWRLDYALLSQALLPKATGCVAERAFGTSDHGPVTAHFEGLLFEPGAVQEGPPEEPLPTPAPPSKRQLTLL